MICVLSTTNSKLERLSGALESIARGSRWLAGLATEETLVHCAHDWSVLSLKAIESCFSLGKSGWKSGIPTNTTTSSTPIASMTTASSAIRSAIKECLVQDDRRVLRSGPRYDQIKPCRCIVRDSHGQYLQKQETLLRHADRGTVTLMPIKTCGMYYAIKKYILCFSKKYYLLQHIYILKLILFTSCSWTTCRHCFPGFSLLWSKFLNSLWRRPSLFSTQWPRLPQHHRNAQLNREWPRLWPVPRTRTEIAKDIHRDARTDATSSICTGRTAAFSNFCADPRASDASRNVHRWACSAVEEVAQQTEDNQAPNRQRGRCTNQRRRRRTSWVHCVHVWSVRSQNMREWCSSLAENGWRFSAPGRITQSPFRIVWTELGIVCSAIQQRLSCARPSTSLTPDPHHATTWSSLAPQASTQSCTMTTPQHTTRCTLSLSTVLIKKHALNQASNLKKTWKSQKTNVNRTRNLNYCCWTGTRTNNSFFLFWIKLLLKNISKLARIKHEPELIYFWSKKSLTNGPENIPRILDISLNILAF